MSVQEFLEFDNIRIKLSERHDKLTTQQAIEILAKEGSIYWTNEGYSNDVGVDWLMVAIFFNTQEIHSYGQGMVTRIYL